MPAEYEPIEPVSPPRRPEIHIRVRNIVEDKQHYIEAVELVPGKLTFAGAPVYRRGDQARARAVLEIVERSLRNNLILLEHGAEISIRIEEAKTP